MARCVSPIPAARRARHRSRRLLATVPAAVLLAGCHGTNLPLGEFQARANRVCSQTARQVAPLPDLRQLEGDRLRRAARRLEQQARQARAELKTIVPPGDLTRDYGTLIEHLGDVVEDLDELQDAAGPDDERRPAAVIDTLTTSLREFERAAREVPLEECAQAAARALPEAGT